MPKYAALCLALLMPAVLAADDDPEPRAKAVKPREIVVAGLPIGPGSVESPTSIPSEKRLAELVPNEDARAAILKQVDFKKERLLFFSWTGKVGDEVRPKGGNAGVAVFEYTPGLAALGVRHSKLFAVPVGAKVKVTKP